MKICNLAKVLLAIVLAAVAGLATAGASGYARSFALPADGVLSIINDEANTVWRPCAVAVIFPDMAMRTVTVFRVAGALEYPLAQTVAEARSYVYEFLVEYWSETSNGVKVTVSPPSTGTVEVVYE